MTVTQLPPASGPLFGLTPVTVGAATNVNWSAVLVALVPPAFVSVTSTVPAGLGGRYRRHLSAAADRKALALRSSRSGPR